MADAAVKQLQADVARILLALADLRQAADGWPTLAARMEQAHLAALAEVSGKFDRALDQQRHIIDQNDRIVRWADGDEAAWPIALRGISALADRQDQHAAGQAHIEAALAGFVDRFDALDAYLHAHDARVADRVEQVSSRQTATIERTWRIALASAMVTAATLAFIIAHAYISAIAAGVSIAWPGW